MKDRDTVRLVVMDEQKRVLMLRLEDKIAPEGGTPIMTVFWVTPGGGVEADETPEQALIREAWEETGLKLSDAGQWVWSERHITQFDDAVIRFNNRFYFVRITTHEADFSHLLDYEQTVIKEHRWWSIPEIRDSQAIFFPTGLADLLTPLAEGKIPTEPVTIEH